MDTFIVVSAVIAVWFVATFVVILALRWLGVHGENLLAPLPRPPRDKRAINRLPDPKYYPRMPKVSSPKQHEVDMPTTDFIVIRTKDVERYLDQTERDVLDVILEKMLRGRIRDGAGEDSDTNTRV